MPTTAFDVESIKQSIVGKLQRYNGVTVQEATPAAALQGGRLYRTRPDHAKVDGFPPPA